MIAYVTYQLMEIVVDGQIEAGGQANVLVTVLTHKNGRRAPAPSMPAFRDYQRSGYI